MPTIGLAKTEKDLWAVYRFRYAVYVEEMARTQKYACHEKRAIIDPLDVPDAQVIAAWEGDEVVGTVRCNLLRTSNVFEYSTHYGLHDVLEPLDELSVTTRLMIHPRYRGTTLATRLSCAAYRVGLNREITNDFIDCNSHLIGFFSRLGYRTHRSDLVHPEYGAVTVMRLDLHDGAHLQALRSPFARILRTWTESNRPVLLNG